MLSQCSRMVVSSSLLWHSVRVNSLNSRMSALVMMEAASLRQPVSIMIRKLTISRISFSLILTTSYPYLG